MHRFVDVVWLRLIAVPRCRFDMTVGRQDADVADQHHHGEKKKTQPGHYDVVSRQPHWEELYTVLYRRQAKSLRRAPLTLESYVAFLGRHPVTANFDLWADGGKVAGSRPALATTAIDLETEGGGGWSTSDLGVVGSSGPRQPPKARICLHSAKVLSRRHRLVPGCEDLHHTLSGTVTWFSDAAPRIGSPLTPQQVTLCR